MNNSHWHGGTDLILHTAIMVAAFVGKLCSIFDSCHDLGGMSAQGVGCLIWLECWFMWRIQYGLPLGILLLFFCALVSTCLLVCACCWASTNLQVTTGITMCMLRQAWFACENFSESRIARFSMLNGGT